MAGVTLAQRIRSDSTEDRIYLGGLVERATAGEFGSLLRLIINGIYDDQLGESMTNAKIPADRYLGRMESLKILQDSLIRMIEVKHQLEAELKQESRVA